MAEYKKFKDFIIVERVKKENRHKSTTYIISEDCVNSKSSAVMIVNYLVRKFKLEYF